jgi:hypothetical protein
MDTLETRLQKRIYVSLYALLFLAALLGLSVILEGCAAKGEITSDASEMEIVSVSKGFFV